MTHDEAHRRLVLRTNELFHDLEGAAYATVHPEIFEREKMRWERLTDAYLPKNKALVALDLGSGTGFVGECLLAHMRAESRLICADISKEMLNVSVERLTALFKNSQVEPLHMRDERIALPDEAADVITMNSVLHHIPDSDLFLKEIYRVLKPGGLLFIGHEPNTLFYRSPLLMQSLWMHYLAPKRIAASILKMLGLYDRTVKQKADPLLDALNVKLMEEKLIESPLTRADLSPLIDVHSPTAGGLRKEEGFDPFTLPATCSLRLVHAETYNHLGKLSGKHAVLRPYESLLRWVLPKKGATFFLIAKKAS